MLCVPAVVGNPELIGKACELLAYHSGDTTIPAYYDLVLGEKLSRDEDSKEMLKLIYGNITYDAGVNYVGFEANMMALFYTLQRLVVRDGSANFASWYDTYGPGAESEIETFIKSVQE